MPRSVLALMSLILIVVASVGRAQEPAATTRRHEIRLALVIANTSYKASPLATALNDGGLVAQALAQAGFDVTAGGDVDGQTIRQLFRDFQVKLQGAGPDAVAFVYLAGYGLQFDGETYFAPIDARIARDTDVPAGAVRVSELADLVEATPAQARIFVYDLARATPFAAVGLPLASGLGVPAVARAGRVTAFNAAPGSIGLPDTAPYGEYARALAEMIQEPGLSVASLFRRVRLRVAERTNGAVIPFDSGTTDFVFYPGRPRAPGDPASSDARRDDTFASCVAQDTLSAYADFTARYPQDPLTVRVRRIVAVRREALIWREAVQANTTRAYWTYMRRYPRGPHFGDVRRRLAALHDFLEPPPRFDLYDFQERPPAAEELATFGERDVLLADPAWAPIPPIPALDLQPSRAAFYEDSVPPPIPPRGAIPVPMPIPLPMTGRSDAFGRIVQPAAPGRDDAITAEMTGSTVILARSGKVLSRTVLTVDGNTRVIAQSTPGGATISRTVTVRDRDTLATMQRGPSGEVLTQALTKIGPDGGVSTALVDGHNRLIADRRVNPSGILVSAVRGIVPALEQVFAFVPAEAPDHPPSVLSLAQIEGDVTVGPAVNVAQPMPQLPHPASVPLPASRVSDPPIPKVAADARSDGPSGRLAQAPTPKPLSPTGGANLSFEPAKSTSQATLGPLESSRPTMSETPPVAPVTVLPSQAVDASAMVSALTQVSASPADPPDAPSKVNSPADVAPAQPPLRPEGSPSTIVPVPLPKPGPDKLTIKTPEPPLPPRRPAAKKPPAPQSVRKGKVAARSPPSAQRTRR